MSLESRTNSALMKRAEQLKRWEESDTNREPVSPKHKSRKVNFSSGCVFLAACAAGDKEEVLKLLEMGADINTANVDGLTALHQVNGGPLIVTVVYRYITLNAAPFDVSITMAAVVLVIKAPLNHTMTYKPQEKFYSINLKLKIRHFDTQKSGYILLKQHRKSTNLCKAITQILGILCLKFQTSDWC